MHPVFAVMIEGVLLCGALLFLPLALYFAALVLAALLSPRQNFVPLVIDEQTPGIVAIKPIRFAILVPAHNEEASIANTLASLQQLRYPRAEFEIIVIADNCEDKTAQIARSSGADQVFERSHDTKRAKGYALEYAIDELKASGHPPDAVVIIDADTKVDPQLLSEFADYLRNGYDWLQAYYSVANPQASWRTELMTFALALFNGVYLWGQQSLGLSTALRGNGMCFTWRGLQRCPLSSYGLAEDLEFSWLLRLRGEKVRFVPGVKVYGDMVDRAQASESQRLRWEHGRQSLRKRFRKDIWQSSALASGTRLLWLADLHLPPLSRWLSYLLLSLGLSLFMAGYGSALLADLSPVWLAPVGIYGSVLLCFGLYLLLPFLKLGLPARMALSLLQAPRFMLWKLALLRHKAPKDWVRTKRH